MGGFGSGRRPARKTVVESLPRVGMREVISVMSSSSSDGANSSRLVWRLGGYSIGWAEFSALDENVLFAKFEVSGLTQESWVGSAKLFIVSTPCHFGGKRYWLSCPFCESRRAELFLIFTDFGCRQCFGLTYSSQYLSPHRRAVQRRNRLHDALYGPASRRMWSSTRKRMEAEYEEAVAISANLFAKHYQSLSRRLERHQTSV